MLFILLVHLLLRDERAWRARVGSDNAVGLLILIKQRKSR